jgi:DNA polymerase III delta subunit
MGIILITGDDTHGIEEYVRSHKTQLPSEWSQLNTHEYDNDQLSNAIADAGSPGFGCNRLLIIRGKVTDKAQWVKLFEQALPDNTVLVVPDGSTPAWFPKCEKKSFRKPPEWREKEIQLLIRDEALKRGLPLPQRLIEHLQEAIGNDTGRIASELDALALVRGHGKLTGADVKDICPNTRTSVFELAAAIRDRKFNEVVQSVNNLIDQGEPPIKIVATLLTLFRQWVRVKVGADCCDINPKRLPHIQREISKTSDEELIAQYSALGAIYAGIVNGQSEEISLALVGVARTKNIKPQPESRGITTSVTGRLRPRRRKPKLSKLITWSPYDVPVIKDGKCDVDESELRLDYKPDFEIPDWQPSKQIPPYESTPRVYLDIETLGLDPECDRIIAVGIQLDGESPKLLSDLDEAKLLKSALATLTKLKPQILVGHNHISFDLPFIIKRCNKHGIKHPFRQSDRQQMMTYASVHGEPIRFFPVYWRGVNIVDTYHLVGAEDKRTAKFTSYGLKDCAIQIGARAERRLELTHTEISNCWQTGETEKILEYLAFDLEDTKALADYLVPAIYYQSEVVPLPIQEIATASPAKIWEAILEAHYGRNNSPKPDEKLSYGGGYVACTPGLYRDCAKIDVSSMYPSIQLRYGISSRKDSDRHYLAVLQYLRTKRLDLKLLAKQTGDKSYKQRELALKILINGGYGFSGTGGYPFNCMATAALVTAYGRKLIQLMIDTAKRFGATIIECDTDGIILSHSQPEAVFKAVQSALPEGIGIDLDWTGKDVFVPKMKNYMIFSKDGKVKATGEFRKRNRSELQRQFPIEFVKAYLDSPDKAHALYQQIREQIISGSYPVGKLSITQRIPKGAKQLLQLGKPGELITYYWGELPAYDKYCRRVEGERIPITSGEYFTSYYACELRRMRAELIQVIDPNFFDEVETPISTHKQLSLVFGI